MDGTSIGLLLSRNEEVGSIPRCRVLRALAGAMAVHGALLCGIVSLAKGARARSFRNAVTTPIVDALDFDVVELPAERAPTSSHDARSRIPPRSDALAMAHVAGSAMTSRGRGRDLEGTSEPAREAPPVRDAHLPTEPPSPPSSGVTMGAAPAGVAAIGLGLGEPNAFVTRPGPAGVGAHLDAPTEAEAKRSADASLREPAQRRDREVGLGPEAPVLKALGNATTASTAPVTGRAIFVAVADGTGLIIGIDVVECDGARPGWAHAAELARAGLRGTKLHLPSSARRAEMRVEVVSAWKLPSGHDPGTDVSVFGVQTSKGDGKNSPKVAVMDIFPKVRVVELSRDLKLPVVIVDPDLISIKGDSSNDGAKPRRIVQTRLIGTTVL